MQMQRFFTLFNEVVWRLSTKKGFLYLRLDEEPTSKRIHQFTTFFGSE